MPDVFVSYAREDLPTTARVVRVIEAQGWTVWWDPDIPIGREFSSRIEEALDSSHCVVALFSRASVASQWVRIEAQEAFRRGILVPVVMDPALEVPGGLPRFA